MMNYNRILVEIEKQKLQVPQKKKAETFNSQGLLVGGIIALLIVLMLIS